MSGLSSRVPDIFDQLVRSCEGRGGLLGVQVNSGPMGKQTKPKHLLFLRAAGAEEQSSSGLENREEFPIIYGQIWVQVPGAKEQQISDSRREAYRILAELRAVLADETDAIHTYCDYIELTYHGYGQDISTPEQGRVSILEFEISFMAAQE